MRISHLNRKKLKYVSSEEDFGEQESESFEEDEYDEEMDNSSEYDGSDDDFTYSRKKSPK